MVSIVLESLKTKKALFLWAVASLACMLLIFLASSQAGDESGKVSEGLTRLIFGTVWRWLAPDGQEMSESMFEALEAFLRKAAHFVSFMTLGICAANTVRQVCIQRWIAASRNALASREDGEGNALAHQEGGEGNALAFREGGEGKSLSLRVFLVSLLWCSAYGALDELHQSFVPGRSMRWQDWVIDTVGAVVGIVVVLLVHWSNEKGRTRKKR